MSELNPKRALFAEEAEKALIRCLTKNPNHLKAAMVLGREDFYDPRAGLCFEAAKTLYSQHRPVDFVTLGEMIDSMAANESEAASAALYLASTLSVISWNIDEYVQSVRNASIRRRLVEMGELLSKHAEDATEALESVLEGIRSQLRDVTTTSGKWIGMNDVLVNTYEWLEKRASGEITAIPIGIPSLDKTMGGLFGGEMTIIGARPSVGKTAFGLHVALHAARHGTKVCFVSMEMSPEQIGGRVFSREGGIDGDRIRDAVIRDDDWTLFTDAMVEAADLQIQFLCGTQTIEGLRSEIQRKVDNGECDIVIIDYLQLIRSKGRYEKEHERLGYVSRSLKLMSLDLKIPVVALAQVRRQNLGGTSRCPSLDELRGSGDMEQDADNVLFMHRPDSPEDPTVPMLDKDSLELWKTQGFDYMVFSIAKQRQGRTGYTAALFDPAHMRYTGIARE